MQDSLTINLGLKNIKALTSRLGNPQDHLKVIHVAGTNGKGSVTQMLSSSLQVSGYRVGVFTSPHLIHVEERFRINDQLITPSDYTAYLNRVEKEVEVLKQEGFQISIFETLTALGLLYFKENPVDFVILEVGLGGRLDATNVITQSVASVITKISIDHQEYLGNTLSSIATEKAGIIKDHGLVITALQEPAINDVIASKSKEHDASLFHMNPSELVVHTLNEEGTTFSYLGQQYHTQLIGEHQAYNASIAITTLHTLRTHHFIQISDAQIKEGISKATWAGRFELVCTQPRLFIDGAHNVDGITALSNTLQKLPKKHTIAILAILEDKEIPEMLALIHNQIDEWIVTEANTPRALQKESLAQMLEVFNKPVYIAPTITDAVKLAIAKAAPIDDVQIIGFGSLYMIGSIKEVVSN